MKRILTILIIATNFLNAIAQCSFSNESTYQPNTYFDWLNFGTGLDKTEIPVKLLAGPLTVNRDIDIYYPFTDGIWNVKDLQKQWETGSQSGITAVDAKPSDGWELLQYDFGATNRTVKPYVILYNKYTGIMRIFIPAFPGYNARSTSNSYIIRVYFNAIDSKSAMFIPSESSEMKSVLDYDVTTEFNVPNKFSAEPYTWLRADIPVAYDPCSCKNPLDKSLPQFSIETVGVETSDVALKTLYSETITGIMENNDAKSNDFMSTFSKIVGSVTANASFNFIAKGSFQAWTNGFKSKSRGAYKDGKLCPGSISTASSCDKKLSVEGEFTFDAVGMLDYFVQSSLSNDASTASFPKTQIVNGAANTTGTIKTYQNGVSFKIQVPSANRNANANAPIPTYNNVLGVFSLLTTPVLEVVEYAPEANKYKIDKPGLHAEMLLPNIREYRLDKESVKFLVNPAAGVDLIDIKGALIFDYPDYPDYIEDISEIGPRQLINVKYNIVSGQSGNFNVSAQNPQAVEYSTGNFNVSHSMWFSGPVILGKRHYTSWTEYEKLLGENGLEIENGPTSNNLLKNYRFRTKFLNLDCLEDNPVKFFANGCALSGSCQGVRGFPSVKLKLILTFRKKNSLPTDKDLIMIHSYAVKHPAENEILKGFKYTANRFVTNTPNIINEILSVYVDKFDAVSGWKNSFNSIPYDLILSSTGIITQPTDFVALNSISLQGNIIYAPLINNQAPKIRFIAGNNIEQVGESKILNSYGSSFENGEVEMLTGLDAFSLGQFPSCLNVLNSTYLATQTEINSVCQSNIYKSKSFVSRIGSDFIEKIPSTPTARTINSPKLQITPNPTTGQVTFYYSLPTDGHVSLCVSVKYL